MYKLMYKLQIRNVMIFCISAGVLLAAALVSLGVGAANLSLREVLEALLSGRDTPNRVILLEIRLPRILLSIVVGACLAVVGSVMQGVFKNPLVDSYTLGMSSGAALGAVISIITGMNLSIGGFSSTSVFAFLGAMGSLLFVYSLSTVKKRVSVTFLLLAGVVVSYFLSSVISLLMMLNQDKIEHIVFWTMGSFSYSTWDKVWVSFPITAAGIIILALFARELNILSLSEETAFHLGVKIERVKMVLLITSAVMVGTAVSAAGTIGFIGLIVPHILRLLTGSDHKTLIPYSALGGAIVLLLADTLARTVIQPVELPVGVVTSILGCPFFVYLLKKKRSV